MLECFSITQTGESHKRDGLPCQDSSRAERVEAHALRREVVVAAIADGVGSAALSQEGSRIACDAFVEHVRERLSVGAERENEGEDYCTKVIGEGFEAALDGIETHATREGLSLPVLDTTLTGVVYDGVNLWWGHAGDDGIVAMRRDGGFAMVTRRHKGDDASSVYPLRRRDTWEFGRTPDVASFVMMTDGMLDFCVDTESHGCRVDLSFLRSLLLTPLTSSSRSQELRDAWRCYLSGEGDAGQTLRVLGIESPDRLRDHITDDMTLVLASESRAVAQLPAYEDIFDKSAFDAQSAHNDFEQWKALYPDLPYPHEVPEPMHEGIDQARVDVDQARADVPEETPSAPDAMREPGPDAKVPHGVERPPRPRHRHGKTPHAGGGATPHARHSARGADRPRRNVAWIVGAVLAALVVLAVCVAWALLKRAAPAEAPGDGSAAISSVLDETSESTHERQQSVIQVQEDHAANDREDYSYTMWDDDGPYGHGAADDKKPGVRR